MDKKILISAGGTGGHIFPALDISLKLRDLGWKIYWLGTKDRMEAKIIPAYNIPLYFINITGIRGKSFSTLLKMPFILLKAILASEKILKDVSPDIVLGMGGYASGAGCIAARRLGIPLCVHEQNAVTGLTNKWLSKIATINMEAFPGTLKKAVATGNPVREKFFSYPIPEVRYLGRTEKLKILITGGSQGTKILNLIIPQILPLLDFPVSIIHQAGSLKNGQVQEAYRMFSRVNDTIVVQEFIDDIAQELASADLVIARSGALTVCEVAAVGVASIFIPYEHKDKQQYKNAEILQVLGASIIVNEIDCTPSKLARIINSLSREKLCEMAKYAKKFAKPNASREIIDLICGIHS